MVLLQALQALAKKHCWKITVAHFNHCLRGRASDADERLVRRTAARLGVKFVAGRADVRASATGSKLSLEMAARKLRHEFLARAAREQEISTIALAHHADDQGELFFLRLLRGAGGEGLAGMKWRSPSPADRSISLVRPLLEFPKAELLAFAREHAVRFREDATNADTDILRNRIRRELLPLLRKKYQPGLDQVVRRLMDIVGAEAQLAGDLAGRFVAGQTRDSRGVRADAAGTRCGFEDLPVAVQRRVLQQQLVAIGLLPDFDLIEQLRDAAGKEVTVCAGLGVSRDTDGKVRCREQSASEFNGSETGVNLTAGRGRGQFGGVRFQWRVMPVRRFRLPPRQPAGQTGPRTEAFDAGKIGNEIVLRHWRPGDRFQPMGFKTSAKLQDLFVNAKISAGRRRGLVLAATQAGEIFWVEGLRIGEAFKLTAQTRRKLVWTVTGAKDTGNSAF